jgi:SAM-dependent methyltransferase
MTAAPITLAAQNTACPVCGSASSYAGAAPGWGEWRSCAACTLEFAHPLRLDKDAMDLYQAAYQGAIRSSAMSDYRRRIEMRQTMISQLNDPTLYFWTPAFGNVLSWLRQRLTPGSTVLELGCGLGFFLHALRNAGFQAVGLDVARTPVELNRQDGFKIWHGPIDSMPRGWAAPDALVSFFVLHHIENPIGYLKAARERAPRAPLAIAVHGQNEYRRRRESAASGPPRTLTKWNAQALGRALEAAGYRPSIHSIASTGAERKPLKLVRRLFGRAIAVPPIYRLGKRIESSMLAALPQRARNEGYVVIAFAEPLFGE